MPSERNHPYPFPTAADVDNAPGDRAAKAARNIVSRHIRGIPQRGYLLGDCDDAPVLKGVRDFAEEVYILLDSLEGEMNPQITTVRRMMLEHGCPDSYPEVE